MMTASDQPVRALLFDLDDTLWPIVPVIQRAEALLFDWLREHAPTIPQRYTLTALRERRMELMAANPRFQYDLWALRHAGLTEAFELCGEDSSKIPHAMALFADARNQVTLYDDVAASLPRLASRITLGSLTNGGADLHAIGLAHHFTISVAAHAFGSAKPDPAIFHAACDALKLAPAQVAYVGDDLRLDVEGAQKAGLTGIWLNRNGVAVPPDHAHIQPDANLRTLHELESWLIRKNGA